MYVNWLFYQERKVTLPPGVYDWQDWITGTQYYISHSDYTRIEKAGHEHIIKLKDPDEIAAYFAMAGEMVPSEYAGGDNHQQDPMSDLYRYPLLPYVNKADNRPTEFRICDYLSLRTGYLYALRYNPGMDAQEKSELRLAGLTPTPSGKYGNDLDKIHMFFSTASGFPKGQDKDIPAEKDNFAAEIDIVKGGVVKVKDYYLETDKIKYIRGASVLLDMIDRELLPEFIKEHHIPECIVYSGGGKFMGFFPKATGADLVVSIEKKVKQHTHTAQCNFGVSTMLVTRQEPVPSIYKAKMAEMDIMLQERQGKRWDWAVSPPDELIEGVNRDLEKWKTDVHYKKISEQVVCERCRHRDAVCSVNDVNESVQLCTSCLAKLQHGGAGEKNSARQKVIAYAKKRDRVLEDKPYETLEDIAGRFGFVGVIYGDANNMSAAIDSVRNPAQMREFSERTDRVVREVVYEALQRHIGETRFEIIALAGDDIFLIVPGDHAYNIALTIGRMFDDRFRNLSDRKANITMSLGVCITHYKLPVHYSFSLAQQLLKSAKRKAWQTRKTNSTGTMDWMVIENESAAYSEIDEIRSEMWTGHDPAYTLRPYTWDQAEAMRQFTRSIRDYKARAFEFRQSLFVMTKAEADLFFEYQMSRHTDKSNSQKGNQESDQGQNRGKDCRYIRQALTDLAEGFGTECNGMNLNNQLNTLKSPWLAKKMNLAASTKSGNSTAHEKASKETSELEQAEYQCSPWLDAIEVWEYIEERGNDAKS